MPNVRTPNGPGLQSLPPRSVKPRGSAPVKRRPRRRRKRGSVGRPPKRRKTDLSFGDWCSRGSNKSRKSEEK